MHSTILRFDPGSSFGPMSPADVGARTYWYPWFSYYRPHGSPEEVHA